ncbi:MAG: hypothetical protein Q4B95_10335 [Lonepinella koalarum]|nr:hypothetical protein [Lonepinella koalarum]
MKKYLFTLLNLTTSLPALACDEDYGQEQRYSAGYYLKNGKLIKSKVEQQLNGMQSVTFAGFFVLNKCKSCEIFSKSINNYLHIQL